MSVEVVAKMKNHPSPIAEKHFSRGLFHLKDNNLSNEIHFLEER